jgi:hypothetical protein
MLVQDIHLFSIVISTHAVKLSSCEQERLACYLRLNKLHYERKETGEA